MTRWNLVLVLGLVAMGACEDPPNTLVVTEKYEALKNAKATCDVALGTCLTSLDECTAHVHDLVGDKGLKPTDCALSPVPTPVGAHEFDGAPGAHYATNCRPKCKVGPEASQLHVMGGDPDPTTIASVWVAENVQTPGESITWRLDRLGEPSRWTEPLKDRADCLASINDHVAVYVLVGVRGLGGPSGEGVTSPFDGTIAELLTYMQAEAVHAVGDRSLPLSDLNAAK